MPDAAIWRRLDEPGFVVGLCVAAYLPFTLLGYGTDIDVVNVLVAGRRWLEDGRYGVSRTPGSAVHEVATAAIDEVGGSVLVNLVSVALGAVVLWAVHDLLRRAGSELAGPAVLVLATNPWFWIAATSLGDFVWALALVLGGAVMARRDHRFVAGILFGLAVGCRLSSALVVAAWLLAEQTGQRDQRVPWRATLLTVAAVGVVGVACFVPSWLAFDRTFDFLGGQGTFDGLTRHIGRWSVKNVAFFGVLGGAVLAVGAPRLLGVRRAWASSSALRFGIFAFVAAEVVYFRYPFKLLHLIPAAMALALVVGHLRADARRWVAALIAAQLIGGVVGTTLAAPDVENQATSGDVELGLTTGPLLTDVRCRFEDRGQGPYEYPVPHVDVRRSIRNADCQHETWRAKG